ncbi:MAG: hypothetical protein Q9164_006033 [Protoblastenia rupestris]
MQLSPEHKTVIEELYTKKYIATDGTTHYVYCEGVASWMQLFLFATEWLEDGHIVVHYKPHCPVISTKGKDPIYDRIYCFVRSAIIMPNPSPCPYRVPVDLDDLILNKILMPLRDDQKIDFLWRLGKVFTDPTTNHSMIVLYGKVGHEGKTKLAEAVTRLFGDAAKG